MIVPKVVVAFGGGGLRGIGTVGMALELLKRGIAVDAWTGVSTGAIQAGFLAQAPLQLSEQQVQVAQLAQLWRGLTEAPVSGGTIEAVLRVIFGKPSLHRANALRALLAQHIIKAPQAPLEIGACSLASGQYVGLRPTSVEALRDAIVASAAVPGIFPPVGRDGLVDGGVVHVAPLGPAWDIASALWPGDQPVVLFMLHCLPLDPMHLPREPAPATGMEHPPLWRLAPRAVDVALTSLERADLKQAKRINDVLAAYELSKQQGVLLPLPASFNGKRYARIVQIAPTQDPGFGMLEFNAERMTTYLNHGQQCAAQVLDELGWPPQATPVISLRRGVLT